MGLLVQGIAYFFRLAVHTTGIRVENVPQHLVDLFARDSKADGVVSISGMEFRFHVGLVVKFYHLTSGYRANL